MLYSGVTSHGGKHKPCLVQMQAFATATAKSVCSVAGIWGPHPVNSTAVMKLTIMKIVCYVRWQYNMHVAIPVPTLPSRAIISR